ncbi:MAG: hypothetical protein PVH12_07590 [Candidatus Bathyarchaeota archaeon]
MTGMKSGRKRISTKQHLKFFLISTLTLASLERADELDVLLTPIVAHIKKIKKLT